MQLINLTFNTHITLRSAQGEVRLTAFELAEKGNIKFGIDAPREMVINREEVYQRKARTVPACE